MSTELSINESTIERIPPQALDAEQAVLGALLVNGETITRVLDVLEPDYFYKKSHQVIYAAMLDLFDDNEPIDIVTVSQYLKDEGKLENVGGRPYITELAMSVATTANLEYYAKSVHEKATLRSLIKAGTEIVSSAYEDVDADTAIDKAEHLIFGLAQKRGLQQLIPVKDIVESSFAKIEERYENRDALSGMPSGFYDLDSMTAGFQPSDLVILAARPSMGKCLSFDSEIVLKSGEVTTIENVYREKQADLLTLAPDFKLSWTSPSVFVDDGHKPVFKVTTRLGRSIETTATHPYLTVNGWKKLEELKVGNHVAVPRRMPVFGSASWSSSKLRLLAYLIGDGCMTKTTPEFTNSNPAIQEDFFEAAEGFGAVAVTRKLCSNRTPGFSIRRNVAGLSSARSRFGRRLRRVLSGIGLSQRQIAFDIGVSPSLINHWIDGSCAPDPSTLQKLCNVLDIRKTELAPEGESSISIAGDNPVKAWLSELSLWGKSAHKKFIPDSVFRLNKSCLSIFLNRLFATDGWATVLTSGQSQLGYSTVSQRLAQQVQHLLLRFGVIAKLRRRSVKYGSSRRDSWQLDITDSISIKTFIREIGIFGKQEALHRVHEALNSRRRQTNTDLVPRQIWSYISELKGNESWQKLAERSGFKGTSNIHAGRRSLTRGRLLGLATALNDKALLDLATSDVYWDEIVSIEYQGRKQVYDLTIPDTHNFIANDICVHNTALCLNIAQHVAVDHKKPVAVFSLEMSKEQLVQRMLCSLAEIDANRLRTGYLQNNDWNRLAMAMGSLGEAPIYIDDSAVMTALEIRAKCRRLKSELKEIGLVVIDYIQLMQGRRATDNRVQEVSEISRSLKQLARELEVPVIALSQLSRAVEARQNKRPMLSDLRESGSIEQDADVVMFIYRDEYYNPDSEQRGEAEVIIAKQRNGPTGTVDLLFQSSITRFLNKVHDQQYAGPE